MPSLEVSGEVELPPGPRPADKLYVYASRGDCLDEKAPLLRRMPVTEEGAFLLHLVAQPDTELSLCAATDPGAGRPTRLYGQAASRLHVGTKAEQEVRDVRITLTAGPPRRFAAPPARPR